MLKHVKTKNKETTYENNLSLIRVLIKKKKFDGFLTPQTDIHQAEYLEISGSRLEWLSGFSGSVGYGIIMHKTAAIFVDGRYTLQLREEIDTLIFEPVCLKDHSLADWLNRTCDKRKNKIGFNPWLFTCNQIKEIELELSKHVVMCESDDILEKFWKKKRVASKKGIKIHQQKYAGETSYQKRKLVSSKLKLNKTKATILTKPDSICWLLNIRGNDTRHTPIVNTLAILYDTSKVDLFLEKDALNASIVQHLGSNVKTCELTTFEEALKKLKKSPIQLDPSSCPIAIKKILMKNNVSVFEKEDPCLIPKATKNYTELGGAKKAHEIDGVAMANFLYWLDTKTKSHQLNEMLLIKKLENFRRQTGELQDISFNTICGAGSNGAIIHYKATKKSSKDLRANEVVLIDSGGQYKYGTTDITRTLVIGNPPKNFELPYTSVLKGLIAISQICWPEGLSGRELDSVARLALWKHGLDYEHGTGHGVGSYLDVHEGPHAMSKRNSVPLLPGMLITCEPGFYKAGEFGIRIENLLVVKKSTRSTVNIQSLLEMETLTLVPIDTKPAKLDLLTRDEKLWINNYHKNILKKLSPKLSPKVRDWLIKKCAPLIL